MLQASFVREHRKTGEEEKGDKHDQQDAKK